VAVPAYNWTGFYLGGAIGDAWSMIDASLVVPPTATWHQQRGTEAAGGFIGYQYQFTNVVLGVEGGVFTTFSRDLGSDICNPITSCHDGTVLTARLDDPIRAVGARAGWAFGQWMPYLTGGVAGTAIKETFCNVEFCPNEAGRTHHVGGYWGGGIDAQFAMGWVAGIEFPHYALGTKTTVPLVSATGAPYAFDTYNLRPDLYTLTFRLSYLFNWGGPIVPSYTKAP
jgi:outer membrane immunogenic protein